MTGGYGKLRVVRIDEAGADTLSESEVRRIGTALLEATSPRPDSMRNFIATKLDGWGDVDLTDEIRTKAFVTRVRERLKTLKLTKDTAA